MPGIDQPFLSGPFKAGELCVGVNTNGCCTALVPVCKWAEGLGQGDPPSCRNVGSNVARVQEPDSRIDFDGCSAISSFHRWGTQWDCQHLPDRSCPTSWAHFVKRLLAGLVDFSPWHPPVLAQVQPMLSHPGNRSLEESCGAALLLWRCCPSSKLSSITSFSLNFLPALSTSVLASLSKCHFHLPRLTLRQKILDL